MPKLRHTTEEVKSYIESLGCELISPEYKGTFEKMKLRCACGAEFEASWHQVKNQGKHSCVSCSFDRRAKKRLISEDEIRERLSKNGCTLMSPYKGTHKVHLIHCKCGHDYEVKLDNLFQKDFSGMCPTCYRKVWGSPNKLHRDDVAELALSYGLVLLSDTYNNAREKLSFRCSCGREFETTWTNVVSKGKTRCDFCTHSISGGEQACRKWLDSHDVVYETEKTFDDLYGSTSRKLRFDFFVPDKNLCIEIDGQQHFKVVDFGGTKDYDALAATLMETQVRDSIKNTYCKDHGIGLLRIGYKDFDKIPEILNNTLIPR